MFTHRCEDCGRAAAALTGCRVCGGGAVALADYAWSLQRQAERILAKTTEVDGCRVFTRGCSAGGYATAYAGPDRGKTSASRIVWEAANGPIPDGYDVCHTCDNPPCVLLAHLWIGTRSDNMQDAKRKGRMVPPPVRWAETIGASGS